MSPHLDDAAFSCGGTLATLALGGWTVTVATLFTQSVPSPQGFALACQLDKGLQADLDYMALRRSEDMAAMQALGVSFLHAGLPEAPHRGYESVTALFGPPHASDVICEAIKSIIEHQVDLIEPDIIFAPQAIGGHVDHAQLVRALDGREQHIAWWHDFPYIFRNGTPAEPFGTKMRVLPVRSVRLSQLATTSREAACLAYASQLQFQFGGPAGLAAALDDAGSVEFFRSSRELPIG